MKWFATVVMLITSAAYAQVPHVTQPFKYLWDYANANMQGAPGAPQVDHFELQIDSATPTKLPVIPLIPSTTAGYSTFVFLADPALPIGNHTFNVWACPTATLFSGCVGATPGAFPFVLDAPAPPPLPSAQRLGVGV